MHRRRRWGDLRQANDGHVSRSIILEEEREISEIIRFLFILYNLAAVAVMIRSA
jgi:hypothetical protein